MELLKLLSRLKLFTDKRSSSKLFAHLAVDVPAIKKAVLPVAFNEASQPHRRIISQAVIDGHTVLTTTF